MTEVSSTPMVQVRDLSKRFGPTQAVKGLTFEIPTGQVVGFLGPNGAGKSTTMKILTSFIDSTSGTAMVGGLDVSENPVQTRKLIGYLPENNPLYEEMMVTEFLEFVCEIRGIPKQERADRRSDRMQSRARGKQTSCHY